MKSIVVATDLSARADRAIERALLLAQLHNAKLYVVHIVDDALPEAIAQHQADAAASNMRDQHRIARRKTGRSDEYRSRDWKEECRDRPICAQYRGRSHHTRYPRYRTRKSVPRDDQRTTDPHGRVARSGGPGSGDGQLQAGRRSPSIFLSIRAVQLKWPWH